MRNSARQSQARKRSQKRGKAGKAREFRARGAASSRASSGVRNKRLRGGANVKRGQTGRHKALESEEVLRDRLPRLPKGSWALGLGVAKFGLLLALGYGLLYGAQETYEYATTSPRFELRSLIYEPSAHLSDDELRARLGLEPGTNILAVEPDDLAETIAAHPWIESATVLRHLPDTLEVRVEERVPAAVLLAGEFYLVDREGVPFKRVERGERGELPIITGVSRNELADLSQPAASVSQALDLLALYQTKKRPRLAEIHIGEEGGLSLYTAAQGTRLRLGRADPERALERYDALRAALGSRAEGLELVHLDGEAAPDHPERVVARFVSERDEAAVLADGLEASGQEVAGDEVDAVQEASVSKPKRRIPRYH